MTTTELYTLPSIYVVGTYGKSLLVEVCPFSYSIRIRNTGMVPSFHNIIRNYRTCTYVKVLEKLPTMDSEN